MHHTPGRLVAVDSPLPPGSPHDEDFQLALWMLNIVRVGHFAGIDPHGASSLRTQHLRWYLERSFEDRLRSLVAEPSGPLTAVIDELRSSPRRPSPDADVAAARFVTKAPYLGWEADPHTLALAAVEQPLEGPVATIQAGEYGVDHGDAHATIYRSCLDALDLDLASALDRSPAAARRWYDVHVLADQEHDQVVRDELIPTLESWTPHLVADAAWGAAVTDELLGLLDAEVRRRHA